jgi:histidinol-phosphatase
MPKAPPKRLSGEVRVDDLTLAHQLVDIADAVALDHRRDPASGLTTKPDGTWVTDADHAVETAVRAELARQRPTDAILGEELGAAGNGAGTRCWYVDAIDGTAAYVAGRPEWATLLGLHAAGMPLLGMVSSLALGRRWWATAGGGAWAAQTRGGTHKSAQRLAVTATPRLAAARVAAWPPPSRLPATERAAIGRLASVVGSPSPSMRLTAPARQRPSWGSGLPNGALLVAAGRLDAFVLLGGGPWDHAATAAVVVEAGGHYSDLNGDPRIDTRSAVFTNGQLHYAVLAALHGQGATDETPSNPRTERS